MNLKSINIKATTIEKKDLLEASAAYSLKLRSRAVSLAKIAIFKGIKQAPAAEGGNQQQR